MDNLSVRVDDEELSEELSEFAEEYGGSQSEAIRELLRRGLQAPDSYEVQLDSDATKEVYAGSIVDEPIQFKDGVATVYGLDTAIHLVKRYKNISHVDREKVKEAAEADPEAPDLPSQPSRRENIRRAQHSI